LSLLIFFFFSIHKGLFLYLILPIVKLALGFGVFDYYFSIKEIVVSKLFVEWLALALRFESHGSLERFLGTRQG
jgi:hypothetical protein